jgi:hypothetical protein
MKERSEGADLFIDNSCSLDGHFGHCTSLTKIFVHGFQSTKFAKVSSLENLYACGNSFYSQYLLYTPLSPAPPSHAVPAVHTTVPSPSPSYSTCCTHHCPQPLPLIQYLLYTPLSPAPPSHTVSTVHTTVPSPSPSPSPSYSTYCTHHYPQPLPLIH